MNKLTEDFTYLWPLFLFLQDESEFGADVDVVYVVQQNPDHAPRQMHEAAEIHELTELERGRTFRRSVMFSLSMCVKADQLKHILMKGKMGLPLV